MANFAYQQESPSPTEHILPVKQHLRDFVYVLLEKYENLKKIELLTFDFDL